MEKYERISLLEEAAEQLMDVISNIRTAVRGTSEEGRANAYIIPHLEGWVDGREMVTIVGLIEALEDDGNIEGDPDDYDEDGNPLDY